MSENKFYLTVGDNPKGKGLLAVVSLGSPQRGDEKVMVCTFEVVPNMKAAKKWYRRMLVERPWEMRN